MLTHLEIIDQLCGTDLCREQQVRTYLEILSSSNTSPRVYMGDESPCSSILCLLTLRLSLKVNVKAPSRQGKVPSRYQQPKSDISWGLLTIPVMIQMAQCPCCMLRAHSHYRHQERTASEMGCRRNQLITGCCSNIKWFL